MHTEVKLLLQRARWLRWCIRWDTFTVWWAAGGGRRGKGPLVVCLGQGLSQPIGFGLITAWHSPVFLDFVLLRNTVKIYYFQCVQEHVLSTSYPYHLQCNIQIDWNSVWAKYICATDKYPDGLIKSIIPPYMCHHDWCGQYRSGSAVGGKPIVWEKWQKWLVPAI